MSMMVDPNKDAGEDFRRVSAGRKLCVAVGINRWQASTGTPMLSMGFVVLQGAEEGLVFMERFAMTQAAIFRIARWAQAQGWGEPFDALEDSHVERIMARGAVVVTLVDEEYKGEIRAVVDKFEPYGGQQSPGWDALTTGGEQEFQRILTAMAKAKNGNSGTDSNMDHANAPGGASDEMPPSDMPF